MKSHLMSRTRFYSIWKGIFRRCYDRTNNSYKDYGGRGIKVCRRWWKCENFRDDMLATYKDGLCIERIDNDGNYCPENCKWITKSEQSLNKRMHKLTHEKVYEIKRRYVYGNGNDLAKEYGVTSAVTSEIVNGKR